MPKNFSVISTQNPKERKFVKKKRLFKNKNQFNDKLLKDIIGFYFDYKDNSENEVQ